METSNRVAGGAPAPPGGKPVWRGWAAALCLALLATASYGPAYLAGFLWDDDALVDYAPLMRREGLRPIWLDPAWNDHESHYWPLVYTSFWLELKLWGLHPAGYHIVNVALHAANGILLWLILGRLAIPGAWLAAALFVVHPVHVESVAWIIERKDLLSTFFYLLAGLLFLKSNRVRSASYAFSLACFALAMLSKTMAISFPLGIAVCLWARSGRPTFRDALRLAPFLAIAGAAGFWDVHLASSNDPRRFDLGFLTRLGIACRAMFFYAGKTFWPMGFSGIYPRWEVDQGYSGGPLAIVAMAFLTWLAWRMRRCWGRGPLSALLYYAITLGPVLGFVDHGFMEDSFVADRFQYLAVAAPLALVAAGIGGGFSNQGPGARRMRAMAAGGLVFALGLLTWNRCEVFGDDEVFFRDVLRHNPGSWTAHNNLGKALIDRGAMDEGLGHLIQAVQRKPDFALGHLNLGKTMAQRDNLDAAIPEYLRALEIDPFYAEAHKNLGVAFYRLDRLEEATMRLQEAVRLKPRDAKAWNNLGLVMAARGQGDEAIAHFQRALAVDPDLVEARENLGQALLPAREETSKPEAGVEADPSGKALAQDRPTSATGSPPASLPQSINGGS